MIYYDFSDVTFTRASAKVFYVDSIHPAPFQIGDRAVFRAENEI